MEYRKAFYNTKKYKIFKSEIEETSKNLNTFKKILKTELKIEIKVNRKKLEKLRKDFDEFRHRFSNKDEISEYRNAFYNAKKYKLFESEIERVRKNLNKFKKSLKSKKFQGNIDSVNFKDLDDYSNNYDFPDDDKYRKNESIRSLLKEFDSNYYKLIRTDDSFAGEKNNHIEFKSNRDRYENLSLKEYLDMIKPYLRDLINEHRPIMELNNNSNNSNNHNHNINNNNNYSSNSNNGNNEENGRAEWKIQLVM